MSKHAPGPLRVVSNFDGRHGHVPIMSDCPALNDEEDFIYHPKIGVVYTGKGHAPRDIAEATAKLWAAAPDLLEALKQLRDFINTRGVIGHRIISYTEIADKAIAKAEAE